MVMVDFRAWRLWEFDVVWLPVLWALIELSYNWCFDLTSKAWRGWTWSPLLPCFKVRVAWPLPVVKYNPLERKTRVLFVRVSVWIITCEFKHSYCMCVQVCTCTRVLKVFLRTGLCMRTHVCQYPWKRLVWEEQEWMNVRDGNKIKHFIGLEWEPVAGATFCPLPIYFRICVWEYWTRLNRLVLTKQHKINTGDWGYDNIHQPLLFSDSLLLTCILDHTQKPGNDMKRGKKLTFK